MKLNKKVVLLLAGVLLGFCIIFAPNIITGRGYSDTYLGAFLVANLVVRSCCLAFGLWVIYDAIKTCIKG